MTVGTTNGDIVNRVSVAVALPENWLLLRVGQLASSGEHEPTVPGGAGMVEAALLDLERRARALATAPVVLVLAACGIDAIDGRAIPIGVTLGIVNVGAQDRQDAAASEATDPRFSNGQRLKGDAQVGAFRRGGDVISIDGQELPVAMFHYSRRSFQRDGAIALLSFVAPAVASAEGLLKRFSGIAATLSLGL